MKVHYKCSQTLTSFLIIILNIHSYIIVGKRLFPVAPTISPSATIKIPTHFMTKGNNYLVLPTNDTMITGFLIIMKSTHDNGTLNYLYFALMP